MTLVRFGKTNWFVVGLQFLDAPADDELRPVLDPLEGAIRAAGRRVDRYAEHDEPEAQLMIDDECGYVEDLLGAVFVIAQRFLTVVTSRALRLNRMVAAEAGQPWSLPTKRRGLIADFGPGCPSAASLSFAAAVDAGANYFKHSSEWRRPWADHATGLTARTVDAVVALGAVEGSTGNCRSIAEALGVSQYDHLAPVVEGLERWKAAVLSDVRTELASLKLL